METSKTLHYGSAQTNATVEATQCIITAISASGGAVNVKGTLADGSKGTVFAVPNGQTVGGLAFVANPLIFDGGPGSITYIGG